LLSAAAAVVVQDLRLTVAAAAAAPCSFLLATFCKKTKSAELCCERCVQVVVGVRSFFSNKSKVKVLQASLLVGFRHWVIGAI